MREFTRPAITLVVARTYIAYQKWCEANEVNCLDPNVVRFINHPYDLRGYSPENTNLVIIGMPESDDGFEEMVRYIDLYHQMGHELISKKINEERKARSEVS